jgi:hypothetical protein
MKKKTKTNTNKTSNRGRPPKSFVSKKPQIKRDKPGRPKKHEKIILPQIPEKKDNKTKDTIIWILFIVSFFIFGFSIYVSQKEKIASRINNGIQTNKEEIIQPIIEEQIVEEVQEPQQPIIQNQKQTILEQIYWALKVSNFDELYQHTDNGLKQSTIFKTYFSKNRLQRFVNNIDNQNIEFQVVEINEEESKVLYKLSYSVKNTQFIEERETTFITKNNEQKIAKIMCITKGCSTMPFFNPGKYF